VRSSRRRESADRRARRALSLLAVGTCGCAGLDAERNLAPVFSEYARAEGGTGIDALGGVFLAKHEPAGRMEALAVRPVFSWEKVEKGLYPYLEESPEKTQYRAWFLPPLGLWWTNGERTVWQLIPLFRWSERTTETGDEVWSWISLPFVFWAKTEDGRTVRGWFPIAGVMERSLSFDRVEWILWPFYSRIERAGRTTYHAPFPLVAWSFGRGGPAWRLWPLVGHNQWKDRYDRWFVLWPIVQWQRENLSAPPEKRQRTWMIFPLYSRTTRGSFRSSSVLWPFFGRARNPETGFWAWDGPWPLVRFMASGDPEQPTRFRVWPFYSYYRGDGLTSRWYGWPFVNLREEQYTDRVRRSKWVIPVWQSWKREDREPQAEGARGGDAYRKLWPFFQSYSSRGYSRSATFQINPLWHTPVIDYHYSWPFEVYARERRAEALSQRGWLGLYRRERNRYEDRQAFSVLWGRRDYERDGERVTERSYLFGIFRFRTSESGGLEWMRPAIPGPGWPLTRTTAEEAGGRLDER